MNQSRTCANPTNAILEFDNPRCNVMYTDRESFPEVISSIGTQFGSDDTAPSISLGDPHLHLNDVDLNPQFDMVPGAPSQFIVRANFVP